MIFFGTTKRFWRKTTNAVLLPLCWTDKPAAGSWRRAPSHWIHWSHMIVIVVGSLITYMSYTMLWSALCNWHNSRVDTRKNGTRCAANTQTNTLLTVVVIVVHDSNPPTTTSSLFSPVDSSRLLWEEAVLVSELIRPNDTCRKVKTVLLENSRKFWCVGNDNNLSLDVFYFIFIKNPSSKNGEYELGDEGSY